MKQNDYGSFDLTKDECELLAYLVRSGRDIILSGEMDSFDKKAVRFGRKFVDMLIERS